MLIMAVGMGLELFFNLRIFIPLLVGIFLIYSSIRTGKKGRKNVYLIIGISLIAIAILSSTFFKFFIIAAVIYILIQYSKNKKEPQKIIVETMAPDPKPSYRKRTPFITNRFTGNKRIVNEVFEWDDINIQCGFGDTVIDLGMTMLPPGESVVVIRSLVGDIQLLVPFDVNIHINHSTISGKLRIFNEESEHFNSNIIYYPDGGEEALRTVKIITNVMVGNVEVKRI